MRFGNPRLRPTDNSLRVCLVTSAYPRTPDDPTAPWLRQSVRALTERGHRVTVLAPAVHGSPHHVLDGIPVQRARYAPHWMETAAREGDLAWRFGGWLKGPARTMCRLGMQRAGLQLARRQIFDVVHVHGPIPMAAAGFAIAKEHEAPVVLSVYDTDLVVASTYRWAEQGLQRSIDQADYLLTHTSVAGREVESFANREAYVLPFGATRMPQRILTAKPTVPRILCTGRLTANKGLEYLLRAMPFLLAERPVRLVITGEGEYRRNLENLARLLQIEQHVDFLGHVAEERLEKEYANCTAWVNPTVEDRWGHTEPQSVGVIDAYMHGKPVVASAVGALPDVVHHGRTGWLVAQRDEFAIARAISDLINNPARADSFGAAGRQLAKERFDWSEITRWLTKCYQETIRRKRAESANNTIEDICGCRPIQFSAA